MLILGSLSDGNRRDFLRIGAVGLSGITLSNLLRETACAGQGNVRDRSIVFLFLCGGPSHIETFAPNMDQPEPRRSVTGEVKSSLPGVTFGATFPKLAARADRLAIVRSYWPHDIADHARAIYHTFTLGNYADLDASLGAMHMRLGNSRMNAGMPPFAELIDDEIDSQYIEDMERMRGSNSAGKLGALCAPFAPTGAGPLTENMKLNLPLDQLNDRRALLAKIDGLRHRLDREDAMASIDDFQRQALDVVLGGAARNALDLNREAPKVKDRYDTSKMQHGHLMKRPSTIGQQMLLARRLVEAGCRFVTVGMAGWDNHGNDKHPGVKAGMQMLGPQVDHAVSVFLDDVRDRGLEEKILLVVTGEFGRTPKLAKDGGRDHWPSLCPLVLAGGGLKVGQVIGKMKPTGDVPATEPIKLDNLAATMIHAAFDVGRLRVDRTMPQKLMRFVETAKPIPGLI